MIPPVGTLFPFGIDGWLRTLASSFCGSEKFDSEKRVFDQGGLRFLFPLFHQHFKRVSIGLGSFLFLFLLFCFELCTSPISSCSVAYIVPTPIASATRHGWMMQRMWNYFQCLVVKLLCGCDVCVLLCADRCVFFYFLWQAGDADGEAGSSQVPACFWSLFLIGKEPGCVTAPDMYLYVQMYCPELFWKPGLSDTCHRRHVPDNPGREFLKIAVFL